MTFEEFQSHFVDPFRRSQSSRVRIFEDYLNFIGDFKSLVTEDFAQWLNGSFICKKENPNDIDFVTIIDHEVYTLHELLIECRFRRQGARTQYGKLDAYTVKNYPQGHERRWVTDFDLIYWQDSFGKTQKNRAGHRHPKGFVELKFGNF